MSKEERIEVVQGVIDRFTGRPEDANKVFELMDPEIEIQDYPGFPDREWHHGYEGVVAWAVKMWETATDVAILTSEFVEAPDGSLVVRLDGTATGKRSGVPVADTFYCVFAFRDGKVLRVAAYKTKAEALEAAGLSE